MADGFFVALSVGGRAGVCLRFPPSRPSALLDRMLTAITRSLRDLYLSDPRPWMVGFSGGKDSTLVAHLIYEAAKSIPAAQRTKEIHVVCTDMRTASLAESAC